jgi:hypothetical protein
MFGYGALFLYMLLTLTAFGLFLLPPALLIRYGIKHLVGKRWAHWYVRRAFEVSIAACFVLYFASVDSRAAMEESIGKAAHLTASRNVFVCGFAPATRSHYADVIPSALSAPLLRLASLDFFVEHFFPFVVLPGFIVSFAGYCIERNKEQRRQQKA